MLSDPGSVDKSKPMLLTLDLPMLPSATAWASATPSRIYEAQSLRLLPTACLFLGLRITHVVTYTSPKLDPGCGGYRFPERTFTSGYISASWRTAIALQAISSVSPVFEKPAGTSKSPAGTKTGDKYASGGPGRPGPP